MPMITVTPEMARLLDQETSAAIARADQAERCLDRHGYGCDRPECGRGPATSADLLELDAVPDPVDSDAPTDIHARTLARALSDPEPLPAPPAPQKK